jgi:hypothetical protein
MLKPSLYQGMASAVPINSRKERGFSPCRWPDPREMPAPGIFPRAANLVKAELVDSPDEHVYCFGYLAKKKAAGAKALVG